MQMQNKFRLLSGALLATAMVLFLLVNISSSYLLKAVRLDFTQDHIYTLSKGSKEIVAQIDEPITISMYFSKRLAKLNPYLISFATRVQDLLIQYQRVSNGKIIIDFIDPEPRSLAEEEAVAYGLQAIPIDDMGNELFFGIVATNTVNAHRIIPFLQPAREATLEYDLSQMLSLLNKPQATKVAVISSLPLEGRAARPWMVWQQMQSQFDLQLLDPDVQQIPDDIKILMLVNPETFKNDALLAIDQFVMRGGNVVAYVDPYSEATDPETANLNSLYRDPKADFSRLLNAWGVQMEPHKVVADRSLAKQVRLEADGRAQVLRYPLWIDLTNLNLAQDDVVTAGIDRMTMGTPGALTLVVNPELQFKPLITTSPDAMLVPTSEVKQFQENLSGAMQNYAATGTYVLAARISGSIQSPYTDQKTTNSNIIVVADSDLLHDHFWVVFQNVLGQEFGIPTAANGNFAVSILDNLSGSDALISIRNRGTFVRPFTTLQKLELATQSEDAGERIAADKQLKSLESRIKFLSIGLIPLVIVICGLAAWIIQVRRESRLRYKN